MPQAEITGAGMSRLTATQNIERAIGAKEERLAIKVYVHDLVRVFGRDDAVVKCILMYLEKREKAEAGR
jgi:hypothetical protein